MAAAIRRSIDSYGPELRATKDLALFGAACLEASVGNRPSPGLSKELVAPVRGLFVTIEKRSKGSKPEWQLRGCIGTLSDTSSERIADYVVKSAFEDRRFEPMTKDELPDCRTKVSILVDFEAAKSWDDWDIGKHGITLVLPASDFGLRRSLSATYLPQVMPEQGWTKLEALQSLARKAGLSRPLREADLPAVQLERYQSTIASMDWPAFQAAKRALGGSIPAVIAPGMAEKGSLEGAGGAAPPTGT